MNVRAAAVLVTLLGVGCVSAVNRKEASIHFDAAQRFDVAGDYVSARDQYWKALVNARSAQLDQATISMLTYNFARTAGYTCMLDVAEKHLLESLELEKGVTGRDSGVSTKRIFELARFYFDQANYAGSATYYDDGIPKIEALGLGQKDPITLAEILDEYAVALAHVDRTEDSVAAKRKSDELRRIHPGAVAQFKPTRYKCK